MHFARLPLAAALLAFSALTAVSTAQAAPNQVPETVVSHRYDSGQLQPRSAAREVLVSHRVEVKDAPWLRLDLAGTRLADGAVLTLRSELDGATQTLTAESLQTWQYSSAYFNGAAVSVELSGAGAKASRLRIPTLIAGLRGNPSDDVGTESICGRTDDRVPSDFPERARLMNVGCTATIAASNSCFITAGHCMTSSATVVEFNVPASLSSGTVQHPGPEDQYVLTQSRLYTNGGTGNDWGVFTVNPNTETGLMPFEAQGAKVKVVTTMPASGAAVEIIGYGVDSGTANQTQQVHSGNITAISGTTVNYRVDTEGGNSGSSVGWLGSASKDIVAIHTHGGCSRRQNSANAGTAATHPDFQAALAELCQ